MVPKMILVLAFLLLSGCQGFNDKQAEVVTDSSSSQRPQTAYDSQHLPESHIIVKFLDDAMNRDGTFPTDLVVDRSYYQNNKMGRGDIVYMEFSDEFIKGHFQTNEYAQIELFGKKVSRVIGLPGEKVHIKEGQIFINNRKLDTFYGHQTVHNQPVASKQGVTMKEDVTVPENGVFVMPDEWWRGSVNSSIIGSIDYLYISGKVVGFVANK